MKKLIVLFVAIMWLTANAEIGVKVTTSYLPKYVLVTGGISYPEHVSQSSVVVSNDNVYAGIWYSDDFDKAGFSSSYGDELDYFVGVCRTFGKVSFDFGLTYFDALPLPSSEGNVVWWSLKTSVPIQNWFTLQSTMAYAYPHHKGGPEKGFISWLGLQKGFSLPLGLNVTGFANFIYDSGAFGMQENLLGEVKTVLSRQLFEGISVSAGYWLITPLGSDKVRKTETVWNLTLIYEY